MFYMYVKRYRCAPVFIIYFYKWGPLLHTPLDKISNPTKHKCAALFQIEKFSYEICFASEFSSKRIYVVVYGNNQRRPNI